jgi:hypothetical protein
VRRIETAYNKRGEVERITSFDSAAAGSGNVVNEVFVLYNGFGQAIETFQSHAGAVNLSTTPSVQMSYADGSANTIRPTGITYPDGRKVTYDYGAADSIHDQCSLVASLIDSDTGETHLADYQYLGLGTVVLQDSPQADLRYTLVSLTGSNDPDTGDIYAGLDRFGRVKDLRWRNTDTGSDLSRVLYGYDRAAAAFGGRIRAIPAGATTGCTATTACIVCTRPSEGELNSGHTSITSPQFGQCWTLDPTGNWHGFRQDDDGSSTWDLIQARTSNPVNEITDIDNTTGSSWATPSYDANGNMTTIPRPDLGTDKAMTATWDAWNRLVKLVDPDTSDTLAEYAYDGRNFRIVGKSFDGGTLSETRHHYFTDSWQCVEERLDRTRLFGRSRAPAAQVWAERISEPSFYFWRRKLRLRERERVPTPRKSTRPEQAPASAPMFIPLNLLEATAGIEIVHPLGYRIQVTGDVNPVALRHVLEALDQRGAR